MLAATNCQHDRCNHTHCQQEYATPTLAADKFTAFTAKISKAHLRHMYSNSTLALRGAGGGDAVVAVDIHTAQFTGMNFLGVVPAWSRSRPRVKATVLASNAHAPFSIDQRDVAPTDSDLFDRIDNADSLVRVNNFGTDKDQVDQYVRGTTPRDCCAQSTSKNGRPDQKNREQKGASAQDETTLRSKGFRATHTSIFSHVVSCKEGQVA